MNELLVVVGIVSFPGVIAALICDKVIVHTRPWTFLKYGIYTFVFGISSYLLLQLLCAGLDATGRYLPYLNAVGTLKTWLVLSSATKEVSYPEIVWSSILAIPVAGTVAWAVNHKVLNRLAQKVCISRKFGDENLFSYFLNSPSIDWVYVRDRKSGLTYQGRVQSFSEVDGMQEIVLAEVTVFDYETSDEFYSVPFAYLCKENGNFVIEAVPTEVMGVNSDQESYQGRDNTRSDQRGANPSADHTNLEADTAATSA